MYSTISAGDDYYNFEHTLYTLCACIQVYMDTKTVYALDI